MSESNRFVPGTGTLSAPHGERVLNETPSRLILVIDDDPLVRSGVARHLAARGFDVRMAVDGLDAIQASQAESYDFILLDVAMPERNGADVLRLLRSAPRTARARVFLMAEAGDTEQLDLAMNEGAEGVFRKDELTPRDIAHEVALLLSAGETQTGPIESPSRPTGVVSVPAAVDQIAARFRNPDAPPRERPARVAMNPVSTTPAWARREPSQMRDAVDVFEQNEKIQTRGKEITGPISRRRFAPRPAHAPDGRLTLTGEIAPPASDEVVPTLTDEVPPHGDEVMRGLSAEAQLMDTGEIRLSQTGEVHLKSRPPVAPGREFGNPQQDVYAGVINPLLGGVARLAETLGLPANLACPNCNVQILLQLTIDDAARRTVRGRFACPSCGTDDTSW